jgi:hypothetical protein
MSPGQKSYWREEDMPSHPPTEGRTRTRNFWQPSFDSNWDYDRRGPKPAHQTPSRGKPPPIALSMREDAGKTSIVISLAGDPIYSEQVQGPDYSVANRIDEKLLGYKEVLGRETWIEISSSANNWLGKSVLAERREMAGKYPGPVSEAARVLLGEIPEYLSPAVVRWTGKTGELASEPGGLSGAEAIRQRARVKEGLDTAKKLLLSGERPREYYLERAAREAAEKIVLENYNRARRCITELISADLAEN